MNNKGFTIIEMLIVVAILGTLAALIIPSVSSIKSKTSGVVEIVNEKQEMYTEIVGVSSEFDGAMDEIDEALKKSDEAPNN